MSRQYRKQTLREAMSPLQKLLALFLICFTCFFGFLAVRQGQKVMAAHYSKTMPRTEKKDRKELISDNPYRQPDTVLAETQDAGREYLDSILFLGDSNTVRFLWYDAEDGRKYTGNGNTIAVAGMGVQSMDELKCMRFSDDTVTMIEGARRIAPGRILITMGTNNLNSESADAESFIALYEEKLKLLRQACPDADMIVNSIPPISEKCIYEKLSISQINEFNDAIIAMCERNGWKYLNSFEALRGEGAYADPSLIDGDGLHLNEKGVAKLFAFVRTHAFCSDQIIPLPVREDVIGPLTDMLLNL